MSHQSLPEISFKQIVEFVEDLLTFQPVEPDKLVSYLAWSSNPNAKTQAITQGLVDRLSNQSFPDCHINAQEVPTFKVRIDLLANDNQAYALAVKSRPTIADLEAFGMLKPCWSTLFPIKLYLMFHAEQARDYFGLQPFGQHVIRAFNARINPRQANNEQTVFSCPKLITGQPTFADHLALQEYTNRIARLSGLTTSWVNSWMYLCGQDMMDRPTVF